MKWLSWVTKLCAAALIMTMVSLYATWTAVQMMVGKVLDQYQLGSEMRKIEFSDFLAEFVGSMNIMKQPAREEAKTTQNGLAGTQGGAVHAGTDSKASGTGGTQPGTGSSEAGAGAGAGASDGVGDADGDRYSGTAGNQDALPVWSQSSSGAGQGQEEKRTVLSTEALQSTKDKISAEDKMKLFSMVYSKLPTAEFQNISRLMEDGITQAELSEMETIVRKYLTKEEFDQLLNILGKYE